MRDTVREYVEAALESLTDWSRESGKRLIELVRREVQRQMKVLGVATRDELSELKKRVRALERAQAGAAPKTTAGRSPGKKTSSRKKKRTATAKPARPGRKPPGPRSGGA